MKRIGNLFFLAGFLLVLASFGLLMASKLQTERAAAAAEELALQLEQILPPRTAGVTDHDTEMEMPALALEEEDLIGLIHVPAFRRTLPIGRVWEPGKVDEFPHRFWGSVYNGSLILGGSDGKGQFEFLSQIQNGDQVLVTDMTGAQFSYVVEKIFRSESAEAEVLLEESADLTLFARQARSLDYVIVRCVVG